MKKNKKLPKTEESDKPDESMNMYEFMEMPDDIYIPENSRLIGERVDEIKKKFDIDNIISYHQVKADKIISRENMVKLKPDMRLKSGYILVIGPWGMIKKFEETYDLNGGLRDSLK